ncbi:hypothetical protein BCR22_05135 [Enterococcus plantarum]|uniref:hypothetical protein n=1 Tax=Enterococcus plantarum TaxID=1077675 RepID=UPI00084D241B|nr:hypothetical protein [Enterococcus plantarum]OEG11112.1 hypothetical protein BCR22_05135 [Enterococcus plantarum]
MKKKKWFIVLLVLIGGVSLFTFNQSAKERKEQQVIKMETVTAKQIKNTFANVTKIEFDEEYGENKLTGYTEVMVTVSTSYGVSSEIGVSMSPKDNIDESYLGSGELPVLKKGLTETKVIVIFSNKEERSF